MIFKEYPREEKGPPSFQTTSWVQCRNEPPFKARVVLARHSGDAAKKVYISCPHCWRVYFLEESTGYTPSTWLADRPLQFLTANGLNQLEEELKA